MRSQRTISEMIIITLYTIICSGIIIINANHNPKHMASLNLTDYPQTIMVSGKKSRFCDDTNEGVLLYYHKILQQLLT